MNSAVFGEPLPVSSVAPRRPSVLVLAKYYYPYRGGIENSTQVFCEGMAADFSVKVIAFNHRPGHDLDVINGVTVERFPVMTVIKSQPLSFSYFFACLRPQADIIHFHAPNVVASLALLLRRMSILMSIHHMDIFGRPLLKRVARFLYDRVLRRSDVLVVTSLKNARISSDIRVPVPLAVVPLGIDPAGYELTKTQRAEAAAWRVKLVGDAPLIGFIGRHARYKGLDVLIRALVDLPGVHVVIAGDGPYKGRAEELARTLGVAERAHFVGEISHVKKLGILAVIDTFVFPSTEITEAFGISQLEAMLLRAPVIASELPTGVTDVSVNDVTALTIKPGDVAALTTAISRMLNDRPLRERLVQQAYDRLMENFTARKVVSQLAIINRDLLHARLETPRK